MQTIQQGPAAPFTAARRSADALPTAVELAQRGILVLLKHSSGPRRSGLPSPVQELSYLVLERALDAIKDIKASHAEQLSAARINKDMALGYLLADVLGEELPPREEAEKKGKRVAAHISAESKRIEKEKVRFAEQVRAMRRAADGGGIPEAELAAQLAAVASDERAAIDRIESSKYRGFGTPSSSASRAAAQRESSELDSLELTSEQEEQVEQELADDFTRQALGVLLEPFHTERDFAAQRRKSWIKGHLHVWRATTEANLLAAGLVERPLLDSLRDRDVDLDYYRRVCDLTRETNAGLKREVHALQAQVRELGGTPCKPAGGMSFADVSIQGMHEALNGEE